MTNLVILGEAYGEREEAEGLPFVGASGYELTRMLDAAGIHKADCHLTNVLNLRPPGNKIEALCGTKAEGIPGFPAIAKAKYLRAEFQPELERLSNELIDHDPNLILCLGNTALWALTGQTGVKKRRGTTSVSTHTVSGYKLLATYHPAAVLRQWELRPVTIIDLMKAERERWFPEVRRPQREIWIEPTIPDMELFYAQHIVGCRLLSVDIETSGNQITCIGFAPRADVALVVPFVDYRRKERNYWASPADEQQAWRFVRQILTNESIPKVYQNGLYDIAFCLRSMGLPTFGAQHDTMLLHHALQPEMLKGLGFLGSVYTDEGSWKSERKVVATIKSDE